MLEIVETHLTIAAIRNGEAVTDLPLVALDRNFGLRSSLSFRGMREQS